MMPEKKTLGIGKGTPGPGRKKGVPNKQTTQLKEMILAALDKAGGKEYLYRQAQENPGPFLTLIGRVLPTTLEGEVSVRHVEAELAALNAARITDTDERPALAH